MKFLKYLFNFGAIWLTLYAVFMSFGIIVEPPDDHDFMKVIWNVTLYLSVIFILFLSIVTLINYLLERKVEKRQNSKEFLILMIIHLVLFIISVIYCANDYYLNVGRIHYN